MAHPSGTYISYIFYITKNGIAENERLAYDFVLSLQTITYNFTYIS